MSLIRVGIDGNNIPLLEAVRAERAAVLISANNLWRPRKKRFADTNYLEGLDVALDSGGFVAMAKHGGYRFTPGEYIALAGRLKPTWYAAMDFCCEPEIVATGGVPGRLRMTAEYYDRCLTESSRAKIAAPMPVIQGWHPEDYVASFEQLCQVNQCADWPTIIGIGSVCRRHIRGDAGLFRVLAKLDATLPERFRFHLFGVKGAALRYLAGHPRFASMDSIAFDRANRWDCCKAKISRTNAVRAQAMVVWYVKQLKSLATNYSDLFA